LEIRWGGGVQVIFSVNNTISNRLNILDTFSLNRSVSAEQKCITGLEAYGDRKLGLSRLVCLMKDACRGFLLGVSTRLCQDYTLVTTRGLSDMLQTKRYL
jgi:hypothetical protein